MFPLIVRTICLGAYRAETDIKIIVVVDRIVLQAYYVNWARYLRDFSRLQIYVKDGVRWNQETPCR
jgi:hypothetical protein